MNDKEFPTNYSIQWRQEYLNWYNYVDTIAESMIESSDMTEAKKVIDRIKAMK